MKIPRILIAAPKSGSGKTLLTCALLGALRQDGKKVISFKCGPDYIDPMFHRTVLGIPSENLDTWFAGEKGTREIFAQAADGFEIAVLEGVMGLYDGLGGTREEGSAYHLAKVTGTPILLVADVRGMGRSMVSLIKGFLDDDHAGLIRGIFLNRISAGFYQIMKPLIEAETGIPVAGFFPENRILRMESRHLGLKMPSEIQTIQERLQKTTEQFLQTADYAKILRIAEGAGEIQKAERAGKEDKKTGDALVLAVARDAAFCFYYEANLRLFANAGVRLRFFSPLSDREIPKEADGVLLGGGYPELYAKELCENCSMRKSVKKALSGGLPSLAECGGFMYLHRELVTMEGEHYAMAGVLPGTVSWQGKLVRFGYMELSEEVPCFLRKGEKIRGHEFHYFDSTDNGTQCMAQKPGSGRSWSCIREGTNHFWGFPHLYYPSAPDFVSHFIAEMRAFHNKKRGE